MKKIIVLTILGIIIAALTVTTIFFGFGISFGFLMELNCEKYDVKVCSCIGFTYNDRSECLGAKTSCRLLLDGCSEPPEQNNTSTYDFPEVTTQENCEAFGATWVLTGRIARKCEKPTPDAGNACKNANDCMRKCIIKNSNDKSGTCSDFSQNGCFSFLNKDGQRDGICID